MKRTKKSAACAAAKRDMRKEGLNLDYLNKQKTIMEIPEFVHCCGLIGLGCQTY